jgi:hypothetical protein
VSAPVRLVWLRRWGKVRGFALIDAEDHPLVAPYRWNRAGGYALATDGTIMHRLIMGLRRGDPRQVHHKNENPLDNRKANLVVCANASVANSQPHPKRDAQAFAARAAWVQRHRERRAAA